WTGNELIASHTATLTSILAVGTTIYGISSIAAYLQSAVGWPGLVLRTNIVIAVFLVPSLFMVVPLWGAIAAAGVLVALAAAQLLIIVPLMHLKILRNELRKWALQDLLVPLIAAGATLLPVRMLVSSGQSTVVTLILIFLAWLIPTVTILLLMPQLRLAVT